MTTKEKLIITGISIAVIVGIVLGIKFLPIWATLGMIGTFILGGFFGYALKKTKIVESVKEVIKEVPVEVIREVEKIKYIETTPEPISGVDLDIDDPKVVDAPKISKAKKKKAVKAGTQKSE